MDVPQSSTGGAIKADAQLPLGKQVVVNQGVAYFVYQVGGQQRWVTKDMFSQLAGQPGCPPLIQIISSSQNVSITPDSALIRFTHIFVDLNTGILHSRQADLHPESYFEHLAWNLHSLQLAVTGMEQLYIETATKWVDLIEQQGCKLLFPTDEQMASQLLAAKHKFGVPVSSQRRQLTNNLNYNHKLADDLPLETLAKLLKDSELAYYNEIEEPEVMLEDKVYDYMKDLYRVKLAQDGIVDKGFWSPNGKDTGLNHVPTPVGRMLQLPVWMGSMTKINHGDGQVSIFAPAFPGPYVISAKMDGASALLFKADGREKLYSRGKDGKAQDLTELLPYLKLPPLDEGVMIRGELILQKSVFVAKYKRKPTEEKTSGKYRNSRNAVGGGLVNKIGCRAAGSKNSGDPLDVPFIDDVKFVVYEAITPPMTKCSEQFKYLAGWLSRRVDTHGMIVPYQYVNTISDDELSVIYDQYLANLDFDIDGIIVCSDHVYERPTDSNPAYARAYKKPLACLTAVTEILDIEWNVSKDGLLIPTVILRPFEVDGSTIGRATGNNAGFLRDNNWGPGAIVEVIRSGSVIPKIVKTIRPATYMKGPAEPCVWNSSNVHLVLNDTNPNSEANQKIAIKRLGHFLKKVGVKGVGPGYVEKMYYLGVTRISHFFQVRPEHLSDLGPKMGYNIVEAIQEKVGKIPLPLLAAASGSFGRGIGKELLYVLFNAYPDILETYAVQTNNIEQLTIGLSTLPGFGPERATLAAQGFSKLLVFLNELRAAGYPVVMKHNIEAPKKISERHPLTGVKITLTGFHQDPVINNFLDKIGAVVQTMKSDTQMLIIKDDSYRNKKTETAEKKGVTIISKGDFINKYVGQ